MALNLTPMQLEKLRALEATTHRGSLYQWAPKTMARFAEEGWAEEVTPGKYRITDAGREALAKALKGD